MQEYRLYKMPVELKKELKKAKLDIIEELFKKKKSWLVYSENKIDELINKYDVEYENKNVDSTGWENHWRDFLKDGWLTENTYYCFEDKSFEDDRMVIRINPALAFGTGGHDTTQIAAKLSEDEVKNKIVFDIGTGSGILAILASKKGAKKVFACDNDPQTFHNMKENVELNKCANVKVWIGGADSYSSEEKVDLVIANIITSVLKVIHTDILALKPKTIIYSGILKKEYENFVSSINIKEYTVDKILAQNEWCGVRLKAK